jgi:hypothetical protein
LNTSLNSATARRGPSGCDQIAPMTARKSAPASTSGPQLSCVMPPIAQQGITVVSLHHSRISGLARCFAAFVALGKKAPKAT